MIIYRGPSLIDNKPIIVLAVYPRKKANTKTGIMVQTYILADNGFDPMYNNKTGEDYSICGNCPHKGTPTDNPDKKLAVNRSCYVNLMHGPGQVYKAFKKGNYKEAQTLEDIAGIGADRMVRLGSYGDPLAVPEQVWNALTSKSKGWTGYTHSSGHVSPSGDVLAGSSYLMLSSDSKEEAQQAWDNGMRTFRIIPVKPSPEDALDPYNEIMCPSDKIQCFQCGLCKGGSKGKSVAIVAHGIGRNYIKRA